VAENSSTFWEAIGKVSVVLAIIATCIKIYTYFYPNKENIEVSGLYSSYATSPDYIDILKKLNEIKSSYWLSSFLSDKAKSLNLSLDESSITKIADEFESFFKGVVGQEYDSANRYSSFVYLNVENTGTKEANNIILDLPCSGIALITYNDDTQKTVRFKKKIELGSSRPNNNIAIAIWSESGLGEYNESNFTLSYSNGIAKVNFGKTVYGFDKWISEHWDIILFEIIFVIPLMLFINWLFSKPTQTTDEKNVEEQKPEEKENI
jgi:hypothetical protein